MVGLCWFVLVWVLLLICTMNEIDGMGMGYGVWDDGGLAKASTEELVY